MTLVSERLVDLRQPARATSPRQAALRSREHNCLTKVLSTAVRANSVGSVTPARRSTSPDRPCLRWSGKVWWAREELNLRPLPCQQTAGKRCATHRCPRSPSPVDGEVTKEKPGCWTRRMAFAQVRDGSNIQLLPYSLVVRPEVESRSGGLCRERVFRQGSDDCAVMAYPSPTPFRTQAPTIGSGEPMPRGADDRSGKCRACPASSSTP
jgi:hypothetical protein